MNKDQQASYDGMDPGTQKRVTKLATVHIKTGKSPDEAWDVALRVGNQISTGRKIRKGKDLSLRRQKYQEGK